MPGMKPMKMRFLDAITIEVMEYTLRKNKAMSGRVLMKAVIEIQLEEKLLNYLVQLVNILI